MREAETWLYRTLSPYHADSLVEAIRTAESMESQLGIELDQYFATVPDGASGDILFTIQSIIVTGQLTVLRNKGIFVNTNTIDVLNKLLLAVAQIYDSEERDFLLSVIQSEVSNIEILAQIVAYFRAETPDNWMRHFDAVTDNCIDAIREYLEDYNVSLESVEVFKEGLESFALKYPRRLMETAIESGLGPGTPLEGLLATFQHYLSALVPNNDQEAAIELIGLVILSNNSKAGLTQAVIDAAESIYHDMDFIIKVTDHANRILKEMKMYG